VPHFIRGADGGLVALAGLWERWTPAGAEPIESRAILTTTPNATMLPSHDRMPVILDPADYGVWLGEMPVPADPVAALLRPCPPEALAAYAVSTSVNAPAHDVPAAIVPAAGGDCERSRRTCTSSYRSHAPSQSRPGPRADTGSHS
jgi:putative SOS response-associated peptidase YedK